MIRTTHLASDAARYRVLRSRSNDHAEPGSLKITEPACWKGPQPESSAARKQPMPRFNADEGYRIAYQVDSQTRRVVVSTSRFALAPEVVRG